MIAKPEILQSVEHMIKSKIRKIFVNEYCAEIYEIDPYYYEYYKKNKS